MSTAFNQYKDKFTTKALANGFSDGNIQKCLKYAKPLITNDIPVIYNTTHFCSLVGFNKSYIKRAVNHPAYFYREFEILKKNGQKRALLEPLPNLKEIQNWILESILYKIKVSAFAKGYIPKKNIKHHVKFHCNQEQVLTLDIEKFFDSISFNHVENIFLDLGYSDSISNLITKLCFVHNKLPQGAPTSPYISNLILSSFDNKIGKFSLEKNIKYSRYADDMAFSGIINQNMIIKSVTQELAKLGLSLNQQKTKLMHKNQQQIISGIVVNKKPQTPKKIRNDIRNQLYYIKKFGLENHMKMTNQKYDSNQYLKHLIGKVNYILLINPKDLEFIEYKRLLYEQLNKIDNTIL